MKVRLPPRKRGGFWARGARGRRVKVRLPPRKRRGFWARAGLLGTSQGKPIPYAAEEFHETSDQPNGYIQQHRSYSSDRSVTNDGGRGAPRAALCARPTHHFPYGLWQWN